MGKLFIDYTGRRFGRLLVISEFKEGKYRWCVCQCDCGKKPTVRKNSLPYGTTQSCGCLSVDTSRTHGKSASLAYASWKAMKERCYRTYHPAYRHYGGRGITVCDKWKDSFEAFFADMGERPVGKTLDRIDNNGIYEPGNCRWATGIQQHNNKSSNHNMSHSGIISSMSEWSRIIGMRAGTLSERLRRGMSVKKALTKPLRPKCLITFKGKTQSMADWVRETGLNQSTIWRRINIHKWSVEKALSTPIDVKKRNHKAVGIKLTKEINHACNVSLWT